MEDEQKERNHFLELVQRVCKRPAMFVGTASFAKVMQFLSGYAMGWNDSRGRSNRDSCIFNDQFQRFLVLKYGTEEAKRRYAETGDTIYINDDGSVYPLYSNIVWWHIYHAHFGVDHPDAVLLDMFNKDFEDFVNPLTRLATEVQ